MRHLAPAVARPSDPVDDRYLNRELSSLDFYQRVLDLVRDHRVPLLERVRFAAIVASSLDEFFMVRVAGLQRLVAAGAAVRSPDGRAPATALIDIRRRVTELSERLSATWERALVPALAREGILIGSVADCDSRERDDLERRFEREILPVLTPLAVGPGQPFPYISGLSLSLAVFVHDPQTEETRFARVKVPEVLPRFVVVGRRGLLIPQEEVIAHFLDRLFAGMQIIERGVFRVTRDSDLELSDEADDLLEAVELELRRRRFGDVVRLEVSDSISDEMLDRIEQGVGVSDAHVYPSAGMLDFADLSQLADLDRPDLRYDPWLPVTPGRLAHAADPAEIFAEITHSDLLVQLPYDSFATSVEAFVRSAATDPDAVAIKTTVYRTSDDSALMPALTEAAEAGKQTVCLVELKARFDERRNITWSRAMEQAGVHVVHGFANLKIHAKTTLVVRREGDALRRYAHIGTGNYNAVTARLYEDFGLFTDDEEITADLADLFNHLTGFGRPRRFRKLLVAPFNLRSSLIERIREVAEAAAAGRRARARIKVNAIIDVPVIEALYRCSQAGAEVDVIARSICALRPGVEGLSENIRVRSVVGRFLEHSRVFWFEAGDRTTVLMGSADLMPRNLDHRIEVVTPVEDGAGRAEIETVLDTLLADRSQAWELGPDGGWTRLRPGGERSRPTHATLMRRARVRARRRARTPSQPA